MAVGRVENLAVLVEIHMITVAIQMMTGTRAHTLEHPVIRPVMTIGDRRQGHRVVQLQGVGVGDGRSTASVEEGREGSTARRRRERRCSGRP